MTTSDYRKRVCGVLGIVVLTLLLSGCLVPPVVTPCPTCAPTAAPTATATPIATPAPVMWDGRLSQLGLYVLDMPGTWDMEAAWLTVNGDWSTAPQWAKDRYPWNNLGCDHCVYGIAIDKNGTIRSDKGFLLSWPDGADKRTPAECGDPSWANLPIYAGFDWSQTTGAYSWETYGGDRLVGAGLPFPPLPWQSASVSGIEGGYHVSYFCAWREQQ